MKLNVTIANIIITLSLCSSLSAQETGNARGLIVESPYEVESGWLKPFQRKVMLLEVIQQYGPRILIEY